MHKLSSSRQIYGSCIWLYLLLPHPPMANQVILFCRANRGGPWQFWTSPAAARALRGKQKLQRMQLRESQSTELWKSKIYFGVVLEMIKVSAICSGRILRNLFVCCCFFFFFLLHEEGNTHSSWISLIAFVYNTWPWLITQWLPGFPWGSWLYRIFKMHSTAPWEWCCCVEGLAIFLPGNITKTTEVGGVQNLAEGAHEPLINAHDEITMLILEPPPPSRIM